MVNTYEQTMVEPLQVSNQWSRMINMYSRVTQFLSWPFIYLLFKPFFKIEITGREHLGTIKSPFILISNHIRFYDSFLFRLVLGIFTPHLPLRFMAVKKFNWPFLNFLATVGIIDLIYFIFGVFTITPGLGVKENLKKPIQILNSGGNIVIYPEGKISFGAVSPFKKGAAILTKITKAPILVLSFRIVNLQGSYRKRVLINIGEPQYFYFTDSVSEITAKIYEEVRSLYNRK